MLALPSIVSYMKVWMSVLLPSYDYSTFILTPAPTEDLDRLLNINVKGVFFSYKYAAIQLIKQGKGGRIVGAASIAGKKGPRRVYSAEVSTFTLTSL